MRTSLRVGVLLLASLATVPAAALEGVRSRDIRRHVTFLSSDALAGRDTGQRGIALAEDYIAAHFRAVGLDPLPGRSDYFVEFPLYRRAYDGERTTLEVHAGSRRERGTLGEDFRPFDFSDEGIVEGDVVFAGYGITAPEHGWDDYAELDVRGKIVLILRHEPGEGDPQSPFDGTASTAHATFASKAANAREHGAAGMLLVTDPLHHDDGDDMRVGGRLRLDPPDSDADADASADADEADEPPPLVALQISRALAAALVEPGGVRLKAMQRAVDSGTLPSGFPLAGARATLSVRRAAETETVTARNVAGFLAGSDPRLKDEWVVVGGHHDHLGAYSGRGDTVFNGADDNASGTSGVLALAQAFAGRERRPRRSLLFVTFSGEEKGLLGSRALIEQDRIPRERVVFMLNLDMIGRNPERRLDVVGDGFGRGVRRVVEDANREPALDLEFGGDDYAGNSDHDAFYEADIPFLFFFTGLHEHYHRLGDHANRLSYRRMESIVRLAYGVVDRIADADEPVSFVHHVNWLGVRVETVRRDETTRAVVTHVESASRAERAGLSTGDVITAFDERPLEDPRKVGEGFRAIDPGSTVTLGLMRDRSPLAVTVERARTGYLGIGPGSIDDDERRSHGLADDEGLLVRSVAADGPSDRAGLKSGDILIRIDGRPVGRGNLRGRLAQIGAGETIEVTVIRDGERKKIELTLGERPRR